VSILGGRKVIGNPFVKMHKGTLDATQKKPDLCGKSSHFSSKNKNRRLPMVHGEPWNLQVFCSMVKWANRGVKGGLKNPIKPFFILFLSYLFDFISFFPIENLSQNFFR